MVFSEAECWLLLLGHNNPMQQNGPGEEWQESVQQKWMWGWWQPAEDGPVQVQRVQVAKKSNGILGCIRKSAASRPFVVSNG